MASWDGTQQIQLTSTPDGESQPRWSPDNKYLSFVSSRQGAKDGQVWLMNRAGGEAIKVSDVKGGVSDYAWSPDGKRLVFVVEEPDPADKDDDEQAGREEDRRSRSSSTATSSSRTCDGFLRSERTHLLPVRRRDEEGRDR